MPSKYRVWISYWIIHFSQEDGNQKNLDKMQKVYQKPPNFSLKKKKALEKHSGKNFRKCFSLQGRKFEQFDLIS